MAEIQEKHYHLPPSWQGKQIGQISDFQIGLWGDNRGTVRRSVAKLVEEKPAVILITGDFIYHPGSNIKPEVETAVDIVRPSIPSIIDRCLQAIVKNALEPTWESKFEATSYGFRVGRSTHDAIERIFTIAHSNNQKKWV
ncbi:reverse transcriptase domain-containing protein [Nodularia spumigena]|uniref:Reverse transcriptase domain-containing protein n=1 Tax=Nodularia spumigena UHCC 0060 TaxID=3110300 RepID=A0ABU5UUX3_NODSP|nr:reverse transcriptase domain-containing protein [Nodularia spumigena]MEA5527216.1 reverse transcriptase domain-containing protein [Nodularia spumigena UHCC 0143]MEA5557340.1 reverse transcriptase domain-containing protein [Nodularia spumigena CH309]MEA5610079.1 reverse transcriptase domain-containing protein [Nodularia spumigena UHCC 0060]MEA5616224.1 reverse transcriptase domain-containing protein [Nodularia spumigena UHCC 0040]